MNHPVVWHLQATMMTELRCHNQCSKNMSKSISTKNNILIYLQWNWESSRVMMDALIHRLHASIHRSFNRSLVASITPSIDSSLVASFAPSIALIDRLHYPSLLPLPWLIACIHPSLLQLFPHPSLVESIAQSITPDRSPSIAPIFVPCTILRSFNCFLIHRL